MKIKNITSLEILDSRGNPTLQVEAILEDEAKGVARVPSGASTGSFEAVELRDGDKSRYGGKGVKKAIENIDKKIAKKLIGENAYRQKEIDNIMIELDDTPNKSNLGANAILGVSLAVARASADSLGLELYQYLGGMQAQKLPIPMLNILNGGKHADNNINIQEFMIVPVGELTFAERLKRSTEVYHALKSVIKKKGYSTGVGDEGGFAPNLENDEAALDTIIEAIMVAGYEPKKDIKLALDIASTEMFEEARKINKEGYYFWKSKKLKTNEQMIDYIASLCKKYPIISVEDGLAEEDWKSWKLLTDRLGDSVQIVGDDLFVTNKKRLLKGIEEGVANSILIKPNQIGTLSETLETIQLAKDNGYEPIISHRSGETEDTSIADIAVATNVDKIKMGAPARTDRTSKYNRLLKIEQIVSLF